MGSAQSAEEQTNAGEAAPAAGVGAPAQAGPGQRQARYRAPARGQPRTPPSASIAPLARSLSSSAVRNAEQTTAAPAASPDTRQLKLLGPPETPGGPASPPPDGPGAPLGPDDVLELRKGLKSALEENSMLRAREEAAKELLRARVAALEKEMEEFRRSNVEMKKENERQREEIDQLEEERIFARFNTAKLEADDVVKALEESSEESAAKQRRKEEELRHEIALLEKRCETERLAADEACRELQKERNAVAELSKLVQSMDVLERSSLELQERCLSAQEGEIRAQTELLEAGKKLQRFSETTAQLELTEAQLREAQRTIGTLEMKLAASEREKADMTDKLQIARQNIGLLQQDISNAKKSAERYRRMAETAAVNARQQQEEQQQAYLQPVRGSQSAPRGRSDGYDAKREDRVEYRGQLYYFVPNGSSCYLYKTLSDLRNNTNRQGSPSKKSVTPV